MDQHGRIPTKWVATHRHRKGGLYKELHRGLLEVNLIPHVAYQDKSGTVWFRPVEEFDDPERFTKVIDGK